MGDVVTTMSVIVVANAILLPLAAYGCMRLGLLPGVDWYWPFQGHRHGDLNSRVSDTELTHDLAKALSREIASQVAAAVAPVGEALQSLAKRTDPLHEAALDRMVGRFLDRLQTTAMTEAEAVSGRLEAIATLLGGLGSDLESAGQTLRVSIREAATTFEHQVRSSGSMLVDQSKEAAAALKAATTAQADACRGAVQAAYEVSDRLEVAARRLDDLDQRQHRLDHNLAIAVRGLADLMAEFNHTAGELTARLTEREQVNQR